MPPSKNEIERFFANVIPLTCGCWLWAGPRSRGGGNKSWYGTFSPKKRGVRAHIWAHDILAGKEHSKGNHRDHIVSISRSDNQRLKMQRSFYAERQEWAKQQAVLWSIRSAQSVVNGLTGL